MKTFGLIGASLSHSFSKSYFENKFKNLGLNYSYENFEIDDIKVFPELIKQNPTLLGLNVTIPYKEQIINYLDEIESSAQFIGAVNTIKVERYRDEIKLFGYNTDAYGFEYTLKPYLKEHHKNALILGTGGAKKAVEHVLVKMGVGILEVSRKPLKSAQISYGMLSKQHMEESLIIVNTTPLGMYPNINEQPHIPYEYITKDHILFDLIYNPQETLFLKHGKEKGATCINGITMLEQQAEKAWEIWND